MRVVVADVLGMCFGVRDALAQIDEIAQPGDVTIHGELVHNEIVVDRLKLRGFHNLAEDRRASLPLTDTVLVTAHGISQKERDRLLNAGKTLIDTTCPLVTRAHDAARKLRDAGYFVLVIGKRGHVEVQGIVEDLEQFAVVEKPEEVTTYCHSKIGIMCQTTTMEALARAVRQTVAAKNPQAEIRFLDTICHPTKDHQRALEKLLDEVEAVVVVGGHHSNNTRKLVERCRQRKRPAYHVQSAGDLVREWFDNVEAVGLTAGTSTLPETIDEVKQALERIGANRFNLRNSSPLFALPAPVDDRWAQV